MHVLSVPKEYNVKRYHYMKKYEGASRTALREDCKKKLKQQTGLFTEVLRTQTSGLTASYAVALELAKSKNPFGDKMLVKNVLWKWQKHLEITVWRKNFYQYLYCTELYQGE
jgi:DNA polymerase III delta subunit